MAAEDPSSSVTTTHREVETDTRWAHTGLGGGWWLGLLLVPLILAALLTALKGGDIEDDLSARVGAALDAQGITGSTVTADGRDVEVTLPATLPAGVDTGSVTSLLGNVEGVRTLGVTGGDAGAPAPTDGAMPTDGVPAPSATAAGACFDLQGQVDHVLGRNVVAFAEASSRVRDLPEEFAQVRKVAEMLAGCGASVTVTGHTDDTPKPTSTLSQRRADNVAGILTRNGVTVTAAKGVGPADPIGDNTTESGRDRNRYAAIVVE